MAVSGRSGVQRCFLPFPRQRTWAPVPSTTSWQFSPINSETRRPVWTATRRRVRSRRPIQVERFGIDEQCIDLFSVEKLDRPSHVAFIGHRQDPLAMQGMRGLL